MLIGLSGYGRSGKDTVGGILRAEHGFRVIAFADLMRAAAVALDPIIGYEHGDPVRYRDYVNTFGYERAKDNDEVRRFLQRVGTEMGRNVFGDDFWVEMTFAHMGLDHENWAITDTRFRNEAQAVVERAGLVVRIDRPGFEAANEHISEHDLDTWPFDYWLHNDQQVSDLSTRVKELLAWAD